jgi:hypothetical protein
MWDVYTHERSECFNPMLKNVHRVQVTFYTIGVENSLLFNERIMMVISWEESLCHDPQASGVIYPSE